MNFKAIIFIAGAALLVATIFLDTRLTPIVGAALLLAAIVYGWAQNKSASKANYRKAERAVRRQRENRAHEPR